jgi:hypothetical protein
MSDVTNQTNKFNYDVIIPAQGEFGSDIPAGDGKLANLFFTVYLHTIYELKYLHNICSMNRYQHY